MNYSEKRRFHRVELEDAYAHCLAEGAMGYYTVQDLSAGGALLHGNQPLFLGTQVEVILFLPNQRSLELSSTVRRLDRSAESGIRIGVEFEVVNADDEEELLNLLATELLRSHGKLAVVAASRAWEARALERSLRDLGFSTVKAQTPLGVITHLEDHSLPIHTIIIGGQLGATRPADFIRFLADYYPDIRRVVVARPSWRTRQALSEHVTAIVRRPWSEESLRQSLGMPPPTPRDTAS